MFNINSEAIASTTTTAGPYHWFLFNVLIDLNRALESKVSKTHLNSHVVSYVKRRLPAVGKKTRTDELDAHYLSLLNEVLNNPSNYTTIASIVALDVSVSEA